MSRRTTLGQHLRVLEGEVAELKRRTVSAPKNWLDRVLDSMEKHSGFQDVLRLGRKFRRTYPADETE